MQRRPDKGREYWLAVNVYPEYGNEVQEIMNFISEMNTEKNII
jgi:hypothetical protein